MGRTVCTLLVALGIWIYGLVQASPTYATTYAPSAPFVAMTVNGRPMSGGTVTVTTSAGTQIPVFADEDGTTAFSGTIPATGIVQFFGPTNTYIVTAASGGDIRQFWINIPGTSSGSGIMSINGDINSAIVLAVGTDGTDFNIDAPGAGTITLNIPDASISNRGLINNTTQDINGIKTFLTYVKFDQGVVINESGGGASGYDFRVETNSLPNAIFVDTTNDSVGINTTTPHVLGSTFAVVANTGDNGMIVSSGAGHTSIGAFGAAGGTGLAALQTGAAGWGILAQSTGDSIVSEFARSFNNPTHPVVQISRNFTGIADTNPALKILEDNGVAATTHSFELMGDASTIKAFISGDGNFAGTSDGTNPVYAFVGDEDSGLGQVAGAPCIMDEGNCLFAVDNGATQLTATGLFVVNGEIFDTGISSETNNAVCVKADGFLGTCTSVVDGSGNCTCA